MGSWKAQSVNLNQPPIQTLTRVPDSLLCSAYGKSGQLDAALEVWRDMTARGCERNVITYSSLISACEKCGRWELALELFAEMHREGCKPNVVRCYHHWPKQTHTRGRAYVMPSCGARDG